EALDKVSKSSWPAMPPLTDAMRAVLRNEKDLYGSEDELYAALCVAAGFAAPAAAPAADVPHGSTSPIGETANMPGTPAFTMAVFKAEDVPPGTKLYLAPAIAPGSEA